MFTFADSSTQAAGAERAAAVTASRAGHAQPSFPLYSAGAGAPPMEQRQDITELLRASASGDKGAEARLMPLIYDELRVLGRSERRRSDERSLDTTALVHEALLRLHGRNELTWADRRCYFGYAAKAMRSILCDRARHRHVARKGGELRGLDFDAIDVASTDSPEAALAIDQALRRLERISPRMSEVVELRVFAGLPFDEIAACLGTTERTVFRDWRKARALFAELAGDEPCAS